MPFAVPFVSAAFIEQLASAEEALTAIGTSSPSQPGLAEVSQQSDGEIEAELGAVEFRQRVGVDCDYQAPGGHLDRHAGGRRALAGRRR
jgi:hypothetical protein